MVQQTQELMFQAQTFQRSEEAAKQSMYFLQAQVNILKHQLQQKKVKHLKDVELLETDSYEKIKTLKAENQFLSQQLQDTKSELHKLQARRQPQVEELGSYEDRIKSLLGELESKT